MSAVYSFILFLMQASAQLSLNDEAWRDLDPATFSFGGNRTPKMRLEVRS